MGHLADMKVPAVISKGWAAGGKGCADLANAVVSAAEASTPSPLTTVYPPDIDLYSKVRAIATKIYGASDISAPENIKNRLAKWSKEYPGAPVCIAKTQNSFSQDATKRGAPTGHFFGYSRCQVFEWCWLCCG